MDHGQNSPGSCRHCHQSFCSRSMFADEPVLTFSRVACILSPPQGFRTFFEKLSGPRNYVTSQEGSRGRSRWSVCRHAPASVHISPGRFSSLPTPAEHLSHRDATVNAVFRSSGTLASLARQSSKLLQSVMTRIGKCSSFHSSGNTSLPIAASHNTAGVYSARSRASRHAIASTPKVDKMVVFEALLLQFMKESGVASVGN